MSGPKFRVGQKVIAVKTVRYEGYGIKKGGVREVKWSGPIDQIGTDEPAGFGFQDEHGKHWEDVHFEPLWRAVN